MRTLHWTTRDLELLPDDGSTYEIIDGELYVSRQPEWEHQFVSGMIFALLQTLLPGFYCRVSDMFADL